MGAPCNPTHQRLLGVGFRSYGQEAFIIEIAKVDPMDVNFEKRISRRKTGSGSITLHANIGWSKDIDAHLINHSEKGLCFATKTKLAPGTTVLFKTDRKKYLDSQNDTTYQVPSIGMLKVKWCNKKSNKNQSAFMVGATYMANHQ